MQETKHEANQSFGRLFAHVTRNMVTLMRKELELAKVEMREKISASGKDMALLGIGGAIVFAGFLVALIAAVAGLSLVLPVWAAALVVAVTVMLIGGILLAVGLQRLKKTDLKPTQAIASFKESKQWMKEQLT